MIKLVNLNNKLVSLTFNTVFLVSIWNVFNFFFSGHFTGSSIVYELRTVSLESVQNSVNSLVLECLEMPC